MSPVGLTVGDWVGAGDGAHVARTLPKFTVMGVFVRQVITPVCVERRGAVGIESAGDRSNEIVLNRIPTYLPTRLVEVGRHIERHDRPPGARHRHLQGQGVV